MTIIIAADECRFQHLISDAGRASFDVFFQGFLGGESFPTRRHRCRRYSMMANHISGNDPLGPACQRERAANWVIILWAARRA